ncbi:MAG: 1-deoxy-D-xylulose-5-phosphate reductoisomerase [Burkholderiales bacterium]|nr:1-deoxy-D-xylulose-5-phosphate reductoisomerase [Burkholderiales bacterium]
MIGMGTRGITLLGSTGSIGTNALAVIAREPERFRVVALTAHASAEALIAQCLQFQPRYAVLSDAAEAERVRARLRCAGCACTVLHGREGFERVATLPEVDTVIAGIVGAAGLHPTLAAVRAGKRVLLANKEALVMAGKVFMSAVREHGATLLPIDSEHNAILQALPREFRGDLDAVGVRRIVLTASGGPFRLSAAHELEAVTAEQACAHPNWVMGRKISVDSATMMNKGLEVIEAHWLFGAPQERIGVVIHPQSIVHSMVEYRDGSTVAQLGQPDMRTPIAYALSYPERIESGVEPLDLTRVGRLDFHAPDLERFPCLRLAYAALRRGATAPAVLNAANEVAVAAFLAGEIAFPRIGELIEAVLAQVGVSEAATLEAALDADRLARERARSWIERQRAGVALAAPAPVRLRNSMS